MRLSRFFIDRPIFAVVLSVLITLAGFLSIRALPLSEYPNVVPPTIQVTAIYPGASPETIAETVAAPLEQAINGVEKMMYVTSQSTADGRLTVTVTFDLGTDLDKAQVLVQNRVSTAEARLPEDVRRLGVTVNKTSPSIMMAIFVVSPDNTYDQMYISNYVTTKVKDRLTRLEGVGDAQIFGARDYSMRIWLDPEKIASRGLTAGDILAGLRRQNVQVAAGSIGQAPQPGGSPFELTVEAPGRLVEPQSFENVVVASGAGGQLVRLADVGRVELGAQDYTSEAFLADKPAVAIAVFQRPGSNALETAHQVIATMEELKAEFPKGLDYSVPYNPTEFVEVSITEVQKTLFEAMILVVLVVFLFLQNVRAAIIPILAIPVSILGAFAVLVLIGGSINTLSLFGLILAIGIVVDDAIVVVENVERNIERGLSPKEAARVSMDEVGGALIAISLVLTAVFIPVAMIGGLAGQFYQQFAITIASATLISCFVSLTLSPALAAVMLKPHGERKPAIAILRPLYWFFERFNAGFAWLSAKYGAFTTRAVRMGLVVLVIYGGMLVLTGGMFAGARKGFIPEMDRGYGFVAMQLPQGSSVERTRAVLLDVQSRVAKVDGVLAMAGFVGLSAPTQTNATNSAAMYFTFQPFEDRAKKHQTAQHILNAVREAIAPIQEAFVLVGGPPAVEGLGNGAGVKMMIQDRGGRGYAELANASMGMMMGANQTPGIANAFTLYEASTPRVKLEIDRDKAEALRVPVSEVNAALETYLGSAYVNDFNFLGRTYRVTAQADAPFRQSAEDIGRLWVRSVDGQMIPLSAVVTTSEGAGPSRVPRYNLYPAAELSAEPVPGQSSTQLIEKMENLAAKVLPEGIGYEWTELAYVEKTESGGALGVFVLAALFVFLVLAAQYESLTLPFAIIMVVPMSILGAVLGVMLNGLDVNVLTQIALIVLVGLAAKNSILIVEFAKQLEDHEGLSPHEAAAKAALQRLRPILMTSLAFILGVTPLAFAHGAGAEQRIAIGTAVFGGMIGVTIIGLMLTPAFYVMWRWISAKLFHRKSRAVAAVEPDADPAV
ncbi:MAG TPA: multidrug efflux RND transporter permease subunit [Hyphomonadaceae bacterium]|jgi:hydrophobe/amphiphile efflux-1 (HAE1) family protein|nr:multidrug efflux RND transporter permease subunit [Hyphomonadaceae bacterium]